MGRVPLDFKACRRCRQWLPSAAFPVLPSGRIGSTCKECREAEAERQRQRHRDRNRLSGSASATGRRCTKCGELKPESAFLTGFSHCRECQRQRRECGDGKE